MHAERDIVLPIRSVCPSVCPMPVLIYNEWAHQTFLTFR